MQNNTKGFEIFENRHHRIIQRPINVLDNKFERIQSKNKALQKSYMNILHLTLKPSLMVIRKKWQHHLSSY